MTRGDIVVNSSYTEDLTKMTDDQLIDMLDNLFNANPDEEDLEGDFRNHQKRIKVIETEQEWRRNYGAPKQ